MPKAVSRSQCAVPNILRAIIRVVRPPTNKPICLDQSITEWVASSFVIHRSCHEWSLDLLSIHGLMFKDPKGSCDVGTPSPKPRRPRFPVCCIHPRQLDPPSSRSVCGEELVPTGRLAPV